MTLEPHDHPRPFLFSAEEPIPYFRLGFAAYNVREYHPREPHVRPVRLDERVGYAHCGTYGRSEFLTWIAMNPGARKTSRTNTASSVAGIRPIGGSYFFGLIGSRLPGAASVPWEVARPTTPLVSTAFLLAIVASSRAAWQITKTTPHTSRWVTRTGYTSPRAVASAAPNSTSRPALRPSRHNARHDGAGPEGRSPSVSARLWEAVAQPPDERVHVGPKLEALDDAPWSKSDRGMRPPGARSSRADCRISPYEAASSRREPRRAPVWRPVL